MMGTKAASPLHILLRECCRRPHPLCHLKRRLYTTSVSSNAVAPREIAVLGGGITGLTSAYLLSQKLPDAKITLYEAGARLGGWMQSTQVDVEGGRVNFEQGPRSIRPVGASGMATLDLVSASWRL